MKVMPQLRRIMAADVMRLGMRVRVRQMRRERERVPSTARALRRARRATALALILGGVSVRSHARTASRRGSWPARRGPAIRALSSGPERLRTLAVPRRNAAGGRRSERAERIGQVSRAGCR